MSESVPSSVTGFAHRHSRSDSITSFVYFQEDETPDYPSDEAILEEDAEDLEAGTQPVDEYDLDQSLSPRRKSSGLSRASVDYPLLRRHHSARTDDSVAGWSSRQSQKSYVAAEDLKVVFAGFNTRPSGFALYIILCTLTLGLAYLFFHWLPRWRVALLGSPTSLRRCTWVVVEVK